jgi:3-oxoacyl-(acyl-carrier-protein) synthase
MGIISPLGNGVEPHIEALRKNRSGIRPLSLFIPSEGNSFPVGEIDGLAKSTAVPRTHELALHAAREALSGASAGPDSIIIGTTTGGMPLTEELLKNNVVDAKQYAYHSTSSVAEFLAGELHCKGLLLTITTACSSGAAAIKLAYELLRAGRADRILAGGADALCRLTYYGFNSLQLIDPGGARPLDRERKGMSVAEGSAMVFLEASESMPDNAVAEILGGALSCDAYHPATPHPNGEGALAAMRQAVMNAGITPADIDYVNLHGTGTKDNDLAEAKAINALFTEKIPPLSSVKGATGHPLAAAGAIELVLCSTVIRDGYLPANTGCTTPDPALNLEPVMIPRDQKVGIVLSNSFGFGGNNACLVIADPRRKHDNPDETILTEFEILGSACFTGAGGIEETLNNINNGKTCCGTLSLAELSKKLPARDVRRLRRLPRLVLSLAIDARESCSMPQTPSSIFFGTAWGPLTETYEFLAKLFETGEQFTSPTEFVGSVHNAPAGQAAIMLSSKGANITATGGDYSFEQALFAASLAVRGSDDIALVMGADEYHDKLSTLFDISVSMSGIPADGGGALIMRKTGRNHGLRIAPIFFENACSNPDIIRSLVHMLGGKESINSRYGAIFAGMPLKDREYCDRQITEIRSAAEFDGPVVDFRKFIGEFASANAVAAALAVRFVHDGKFPANLTDGAECSLDGKGILLLGTGSFITAVGVLLQ